METKDRGFDGMGEREKAPERREWDGMYEEPRLEIVTETETEQDREREAAIRGAVIESINHGWTPEVGQPPKVWRN